MSINSQFQTGKKFTAVIAPCLPLFRATYCHSERSEESVCHTHRLNIRYKPLSDADAIDAMRNNRYSVALLLTAKASA